MIYYITPFSSTDSGHIIYKNSLSYPHFSSGDKYTFRVTFLFVDGGERRRRPGFALGKVFRILWTANAESHRERYFKWLYILS